MNILVTGAEGFIGRHLVAKLVALGHNVTVSDKYVSGWTQDMISSDLANIEFIFHLAATARVGVSLEKPEEVINNNISSLLHILDLSRSYPKIKVAFISSSSVKFANVSENPYALTKKWGEDLVNMYRQLFNVNATVVRLFNVFGPGEADCGQHSTLVKACKKHMLLGTDFFINGTGDIIRDFTHVDDVVSGLVAILGETSFAPLYELGSGNACVTVKEIVTEFARDTNLQVKHRADRIGDPLKTNADPRLAPPNWSPMIDVLEYIKEWKNAGCPND